MNIPQKLIALVKATMNNTQCEVKIQNKLSEPINIANGSLSGSHWPDIYIILYYIFYFMYTYSLPKTNEISFHTHLLVIAYYVYMYSVILLFSSPCQTWWWPYRKGPKHVVYLLTPYTVIKCCVLTHPSYIILIFDIVIAKGVRQGDALACLLFNIALEKVIRDAAVNTRGTFFSTGATTPIGGCILQPSSGL